MPKSKSGADIRSLVEDLAKRLQALVEQQANQRARETVLGALAGKGRSAGGGAFQVSGRPKQLCPVPGCKNPAAPVFGMVCAVHKAIPKAVIKKYREQRRAKK